MIQAAVIFRVLGLMSTFFGIALGVPWLFALIINDGSARSLGAACGIAFLAVFCLLGFLAAFLTANPFTDMLVDESGVMAKNPASSWGL